jgi:hypothetical protein
MLSVRYEPFMLSVNVLNVDMLIVVFFQKIYYQIWWWKDEKLPNIDAEEIFFYLQLWTNQKVNQTRFLNANI